MAERVVMGDSKEVDSKTFYITSTSYQLLVTSCGRRLIIYTNTLLLFKAVNGNSPEYLKDLLPPLRITSKQTRSSCAPQFLETGTCSKFGIGVFRTQYPSCGISSLQASEWKKSPTNFTVALKTILFELESPVYFIRHQLSIVLCSAPTAFIRLGAI